MKKIFTLVLLLCTMLLYAQDKKGSVNGRVMSSKDKRPIDFASIALKNLKDSSVVSANTTSADGKFAFSNLQPGNYRLFVAFLGLKTINKDFIIQADKPQVNLGDIFMDDNSIDLQTVEIKSDAPPVVVKKDTLEFNASSFKTIENAVVEDLLKKLPGLEVDKTGTVKAQGETVTRVKVDGKEFFGNDPLLATKNLPADMVDKIQVIDEQSEQAKFTGIDDGNRVKIINITTKKGRNNGYFGNNTAGYGSDNRYDVNLNVNRFNAKRQLSVLGQFNNVNRQGFGGGLGGGGGRSGSGITQTNAGGLNFADTYADETEINASYFINNTANLRLQNSLTQNLLGDVTTIFNNRQQNNSDRLNHRLNFMVDTKIDSLTSIRVQPNISYTSNNSNNQNIYTRDFAAYVTSGRQELRNEGTSPTFNNNILLRHKFMRRGRTVSLNLETNISNNDSENFNYINDEVVSGSGGRDRLTNQLNDRTNHSLNHTSRLVYTEPLSRTMSLEFNYRNSYNYNNSERHTYNYNELSGQYDLIDLTYTNLYENTILINSAGFSFNQNGKKFTWNAGLAVQNSDRKNVNISRNTLLTQNVFNYTPSALFRYNFSNSKRLVINYRGSTSQPTISQLQPIPDNTNTQSIPVGNPDLRPEFNNNLRFTYNSFTQGRNRSLFVNLNLTQTSNRIANSSTLITSGEHQGKLAITPVNVNGVYSGSLATSLSVPFLPENKLNFHINIGGNYDRDVNFTNARRNITNSWSLRNGYRLVTSLDRLDLSASLSGAINRATYSAQPNANTRFYTFSPSADVSYLFPGDIRLGLDIDYNANTGRGENFDREFTLLNGFISRQFFNGRGTVRASVNDALNQNQGISRTANNNTIQDVSYNVLQRYFMFSFTYSLRQIGPRRRNGERLERSERNERPDRGNRSGSRNSGGGRQGGGGRRN
ncbi:outer membrane beta-barrel family protein [Pedobacter sp. SYP-B3415]|uniref:outer membrane beta-barrel family protein n=1 Tax=Pedobacter sp. SYP-B3415 TaxID=2496641 RepID=UPI00101DDE51|nr:outer membrane beta-barrel family protein [Pedobacter sp. SYP-B3415]